MNQANALVAVADNQMIFPIITAIIGVALIAVVIALIAMKRNKK